MLFLILLYYLTLSIHANPIPPIISRSLEPNSCKDLSHCRSIWNIIWSCTVTIFSCTWVSVHPNMPCPKKREKNCFRRLIWNPILSFGEHRLQLFVFALILPEVVLAWAIRQYLTAREIARDNKSKLESLPYQLLWLVTRSRMVKNARIFYYYGRFPPL